MGIADVLVDGENVSKAAFRALLTDMQTVSTDLTANVTSINTNITNLFAGVAGADAAIATANNAISTLTGYVTTTDVNVAAVTSELASVAVTVSTAEAINTTQASQITALNAEVMSLSAMIAAAEAAFVSLSNIISGQETSGMGPIVPVPYSGLSLSGAAFVLDNPISDGKALSAGYGQPFVSPFTGVPLTVNARVKTTNTGNPQIAAGQLQLFWIGCDAAGHATAHFATGGIIGEPGLADVIITTAAQIADGVYHALELDLTASGAILFVDGVAAGTSDKIAHFYGGNPFGVRDLGGQRGVLPWVGEICEVAVWGYAKHTTNYTVQSLPYDGTEGMAALYHLNGDGLDAMEQPAIPIGVRPAVVSGVRVFLQAGDSVTYTVQPVGAAMASILANLVTVAAVSGPQWYEPFTEDLMLYVARVTGAPLFRWLALPIVGQGGADTQNLASTTTTTQDATPTVINTILITGQDGAAANISGFVLARRTDTNDVSSFNVNAVIKNLDTSNATVDRPRVTALSPPADMAGCALTVGVFGTTITITATGIAGTQIVWKPELKTMVV